MASKIHDWLANLKPGDEVAVFAYGRFQRIAHVSRLTKAWVIVGDESQGEGRRFRICDGRIVGGKGWGADRLVPCTDTERKEALVERLRDQYNAWENMPLNKLARIAAILDENKGDDE